MVQRSGTRPCSWKKKKTTKLTPFSRIKNSEGDSSSLFFKRNLTSERCLVTSFLSLTAQYPLSRGTTGTYKMHGEVAHTFTVCARAPAIGRMVMTLSLNRQIV